MSPASLDEALVAAAQGGSAEAFSRLVERHQQALRAFLRRACGDWAPPTTWRRRPSWRPGRGSDG